MTTRFREGNVTITLEGDLEQFALQAADRALPGVRKRIETDVDDILATGRGEWPEKTGRSRKGLEKIVEITEDSLTIKIENRVPYALWVRPRAWFGADTAFNRLVRRPMRAAAKGLAKAIGHVITAALSRGTRG